MELLLTMRGFHYLWILLIVISALHPTVLAQSAECEQVSGGRGRLLGTACLVSAEWRTRTHAQAAAYCASTYPGGGGASLATPRTPGEASFLLSLLAAESFSSAWLGLTWTETFLWYWVQDGSVLSYQGCFRPTAAMGPDLGVTNLVPDRCIAACRNVTMEAGSEGRVYAGLQAGEYCFCGSEFSSAGLATDCTVRCDNDLFKCGGATTNDIYYIQGVFSPWVYGQPNNYGASPGQLCGALDSRSAYHLADMGCQTAYYYVCSIPRGPCGGAGGGTYRASPAGTCYFFSDVTRPWTQARQDCVSRAGDLARVADAAELDFLATTLNVTLRRTDQYTWVGLTRVVLEWQDGSPLAWSNFSVGWPGLYRGEECVMVTAAGAWQDTGCSGRKNFFCQIETDQCVSDPCQHGATCVDAVSSYSCVCALGYTGTRCQTELNECASSPCLNAGTCSNLVGAFSCTCREGFSGNRCQTATGTTKLPTSPPARSTPINTQTPTPTSKQKSTPTPAPAKSTTTGVPAVNVTDTVSGSNSSAANNTTGSGGSDPDSGASTNGNLGGSLLENGILIALLIVLVVVLITVAVAVGVYVYYQKTDPARRVSPDASDKYIYESTEEIISPNDLPAGPVPKKNVLARERSSFVSSGNFVDNEMYFIY